MKAGIWGAGNIANSHADALRSAGIELVAVVNSNLSKAADFAARWGIPTYSDNPDILLDPEIDSVHVCTPPNLHYQMVMKLLKNGKHVLCEKPLCLQPQESYELFKIAQEKQLIGVVDLNVRYTPACQAARELISKPEFGSVVLAHGCYLQEFEILPVPLTWRYNEQLAGKTRTITEIGTHWLDLVQHLTGQKIKRVSASFNCIYPVRYLNDDGLMYSKKTGSDDKEIKIASEDSAIIQFQFQNGVFGSVVLSELSAGRSNHIHMEITGENQNLWWTSDNPTQLHTGTKGNGSNTQTFAFGNNGFNDSIRALVKDYYTAIALNHIDANSSLPTFEEGAYLSSICDAIYNSSQQYGSWVTVKTL